MGQRTRMGRAKTGGVPISRSMYRSVKHRQAVAFSRLVIEHDKAGTTHPGYLDAAAGRARYAAKHAAEPRVKYGRTEQSSYTGPKSPGKPLPAVRVARCVPLRRVDGVWVSLLAG